MTAIRSIQCPEVRNRSQGKFRSYAPIHSMRYSPKHLRRRKASSEATFFLAFYVLAFLSGLVAGCVIMRFKPESVALEARAETETIPQVSMISEEVQVPEPATEAVEDTPDPIRHRDDITSGGRLLSYDLQDIMMDCCDRYEVPYALAIADVESRFDPDAESSTDDYGLMQINIINHDWLRSMGMDPLTYSGNIESGVYMIGQYLQTYNDTVMALMAYNNGPTGAKRLWDRGILETAYSQKVMDAYMRWENTLQS